MSYNTLSSYNAFYGKPSSCGGRTCSGIRPPVPSCAPSMEIPLVPVYSAPGYDALTHGAPDNGDYFRVYDAYPSNCTKMMKRYDCSAAKPAAAMPEPHPPKCAKFDWCSRESCAGY